MPDFTPFRDRNPVALLAFYIGVRRAARRPPRKPGAEAHLRPPAKMPCRKDALARGALALAASKPANESARAG